MSQGLNKKALYACAMQTVIGFQAYNCTAACNVLQSPFLFCFFRVPHGNDLSVILLHTDSPLRFLLHATPG
jgi:hypothetical protein